MKLDLKHVEKRIKSCLGGDFTGKVAVRIVEGEIIACDVGKFGTGMPHISGEELMERVVNPPQPGPAKPQEVIDAEAAVEAAQAAYDQAKDAWFDAVHAERRPGREAAHAAAEQIRTYGADGQHVSEDLRLARAATAAAKAEMDARADALREARSAEHAIKMRWQQAEFFADARAAS